MAVTMRQNSALPSNYEPMLAQGRIEKCFHDEEGCTERDRFARAESGRPPADGGFAMQRGIAAGMLAERELVSYATDGRLTVDLGGAADEVLAVMRRGQLPMERVAEIRASMIAWIRRWQAAFPPDDGHLDWSTVTSLLRPQTDLFIRRPGRFSIRVRPDNVVGVADTLVAVEWSTAKGDSSVSPARFALNHHALLREQRRRPAWKGYRTVATRVELLALEESFTVRLDADQAEAWRLRIGEAAESLVDGRHEPNQGPWCSTCFWQVPCWFGGEEAGHDDF